MAKQIAIIGAGAAGLSAAWDLARAGHRVTVYEAGDKVGGLAAGFRDEGWDWTLEKFYHHWFASDAEILRLADELGVREKVIFPRPKTSMWIDGKNYQLDSILSAALAMLTMPKMSLVAKARFGFTTVYLRLARSWQQMEQYTAHEWLLKKMGRQAYETLWMPMLIGKFGEFYREVNMAWFWARIHSRTTRLGTFEGGFQAFLEVLAARVQKDGASIRLGTPLKSVTQIEDGRFALELGDGEKAEADVVLSTTSPRLLRQTAPQIQGEYAAKLDGLRSMGAVVIVLALKEQLLEDGTYWLNLPADNPDKTQSRFPFLALVEHTNYLDREHYGGNRLVYCGDYVSPTHEYFQLSEEQLVERFVATLPTFNPKFSKDWIKKWWVFRAPYAQPLPTVNHSQNIPDIRTPLNGLYWASMSQVYPWDRGTNYAVEIGRRTAQMILTDLQNG
ncbi:MAG: NAD(P)/FAD-dependent oxidoreductase [Chloroflexi bacterium]|nr:NAD(P)/FAD-dependent oxidoreductase [Chloroflexota bacterium]